MQTDALSISTIDIGKRTIHIYFSVQFIVAYALTTQDQFPMDTFYVNYRTALLPLDTKQDRRSARAPSAISLMRPSVTLFFIWTVKNGPMTSPDPRFYPN
jgi:hypothetical protein